MAPPIPITIVTGFLGSGKTTVILKLLPQLQARSPGYRLALLKNEFGDLAVDSQLASSSAVSGVQELLNGCICCNLVGQLGPALEELRAGTGTGPAPDRIVVETSGSAFPATLAMEVKRLARATGGAYALDGVVSVIDVENWKGYDDTSYTARAQARYTDLVVYNKWEGCGDDRLDECRDRVGDLDPDVAWVKSDRGWVSAELVFGVDGGLARGLAEEQLLLLDGRAPDGAAAAAAAAAAAHHGHDHQSEVEVLSVTLRGPSGSAVSAEKLQSLLRAAPKDEVYRIKAVLTASSAVRNSDEDEKNPTPSSLQNRYILNWAFGRWTFTPTAEAKPEHESSDQTTLRMTMILARYESTKWKKRLEAGGLIELDGGEKGDLVVTKIA